MKPRTLPKPLLHFLISFLLEIKTIFCSVELLNQDVRYQCPVYGFFKFPKPKQKSFTRHIWKYDQGDYDLLRTKSASTDWTSLYDEDIDTHAENITSHITSLAKECIPNKTIRIIFKFCDTDSWFYKSFYDGISNKLKSNKLSSRDWWSILKKVISPTSNFVIPPLESNGNIYTPMK